MKQEKTPTVTKPAKGKAQPDMSRSTRKSQTKRVPRKRVISEAPPPPQARENLSLEAGTLLLTVFAVFLICSLGSALRTGEWGENSRFHAPAQQNFMGPLGAGCAEILLTLLGYCAFVLVGWLLIHAYRIAKPHVVTASLVGQITTTLFFGLCLTVSSSLVAATVTGMSGSTGLVGGGKLGSWLARHLVHHLNEGGTLLIGVTALLLCIAFSTGMRVQRMLSLGATGSWGVLTRSVTVGAAALKPIRAQLQRSRSSGENFFARAEHDEPSFIFGDEEVEDDDEHEEEPVRPTLRLAPSRKAPAPDGDFEPSGEDDEREDDDDEPRRAAAKSDGKILIHRTAPTAHKGTEKAAKDLAQKRKPAAPTSPFELPSTELLVQGESGGQHAPKDKELVDNSRRLEQSLLHFRIGGRVVEVQPGPVITLYEFEPAPGVKVQRIIALADDLALALKVASVRVYAPVPGKGTVGIEVPNANREIVRLRELIETESYLDPQQQIALALGKDTFGEPFVADLAKMPHLLIAGATGTGKSVCINSLLLSLLYRNSPADLRLILIDPKMLELSVYEDIPHLKAPVVTQAKRARGVLWWAVEEMERRYSLMKDLGVRNIASFNAFVGSESGKQVMKGKSVKRPPSVIELTEHDVVATTSENPALDRNAEDLETSPTYRMSLGTLEPLPRIVIVVDELADLMLTVGREIEELLTRLAQKARAAGIHLILATQRPSVNVITGLIKANFPSRISFKVASRIDSRTVLDGSGAEKLLGQGDMLYLSGGAGRPKRLHSPFVSDKEVHDVVHWIRRQGKPDYDPQIESMIERLETAEQSSMGGEHGAPEELDPLYDQALNLVVEKGFASTSMVQRVFRIGYNRAARILETLEREGVVGPADGAKPRPVLLGGRTDI